MDKREKTQRQRQEDAALNKALLWMAGAAVLVALLRWMRGAYIDHNRTEGAVLLAWNLGRALPWLLVIGLLLSAGGFYLAWAAKRRGGSRMLPVALGLFFGAFAVCVLMVWLFAGAGIQLMTYAVIGLAVLALIYYLYQRDFVVIGFSCGLGLAGLWLFFREGKTTRLYVVFVLIILLQAVIAVLARVLQRKKGMYTVKGRDLEVLPKSANYALIFVTCAIVAVLLAAALLLGLGMVSAMAYYAVPVAWLLIMAVYYTVKLM